MDRKAKIIDLLEQAWQLEQQFLLEQPLDEREQPGTFEHWARKDVVAHLETWNSRLAESIRKALRGESLQHNDDFNAENVIIYEMHHSKTWQQAFDFAAQGRRSLIEAVDELDAERLESTSILPWQEGQPIWMRIISEGYNHPVIHVAEYYRWLGDSQKYANLVERLAVDTAGLDDSPTWRGNSLYNQACVHALNGEKAKAIAELGEALRLRPQLREWSLEDADLESLRSEAGYKALYTEK